MEPANTSTNLSASPEEGQIQALQATGKYRVYRQIDMGITSFSDLPKDSLKSRALILDTETTGLTPKQDKVIEIAMLLVEVDRTTGQIGKILDSYEGMEDPGFPLSDEIQEITGLTDEMLRGQQFDRAKIHQLFQSAAFYVAHNAAFDKGMLASEFSASWPEKTPWICSLQNVDWKARGFVSEKLEILINQCGLFTDSHRAMPDVYALATALNTPKPAFGGAHKKEVNEADKPTLPLLEMVQTYRKPFYFIGTLKTHTPFEMKDTIKSSPYRFSWNRANNSWVTLTKSQEQCQAVIDWLKDHVYRPALKEGEEKPISLIFSKIESMQKASMPMPYDWPEESGRVILKVKQHAQSHQSADSVDSDTLSDEKHTAP